MRCFTFSVRCQTSIMLTSLAWLHSLDAWKEYAKVRQIFTICLHLPLLGKLPLEGWAQILFRRLSFSRVCESVAGNIFTPCSGEGGQGRRLRDREKATKVSKGSFGIIISSDIAADIAPHEIGSCFCFYWHWMVSKCLMFPKICF